ncbi:ABC transporter, transmembrane region:ABC transporter:Peptidase C39, bacteriocin processing [Methylophaga frappieri]|uniref:ABC transporter, transmembrane region:ABC transporter:Peptidase C39, bacteriocin processing n=1 Tax=Methylophaga frappieri (strain ATCC BAA-2434 / DSM 25690 / JAM7) TaxID=754477 RepID=I1YG32_METFJ|nr:type I secretion system permease/ATPase [Methylophaga frappieri]AFJ01875.1 ABC transporter, transmembrane region:ABC transporter:Peptidase C39, bacteriocin processing [Methylophaga frappieri]
MGSEQVTKLNDKTQWNADEGRQTVDDPLLGCLLILAKMLHKPFSAEALVSGLPLIDNRLSPALFNRAAERAGLSSKTVKRPLRKISPLVLPAVLLLEDTTACVLTGINKKTATVIFPETGSGESEIALSDLIKLYSGYAIFVKPAHQFDKRTETSAIPRTGHWFWGTIMRFWPIYSEVFAASILVNMFALASPLFIMNVYDRVVPNHALSTLWVLAIGVAVVFLFDFLLRTLRAYFIDMAGKRADVMLSASIFEKVMGIKMSARSNSVGSFANNMQEFESFRDFFTSATMTTLIDLPFALLFIAVIWMLAGNLAYIPLAVIPITILISLIIQIPLGRTIKQLFRHTGQKSATLIESLTGLETIKSIGAETPIQRKWEQNIGFISRFSQRAKVLSTTAINLTSFVQQMTTIAVVVYGVYLISENEITMGALIACTILTGRALAPMSQLAAILTRYHHSKAALSSLNSMMNLPVERPSGREFLHRPVFKGGIEFKNVTFRYPEQPMDALTDVSFKIQPGEKVAVIGRIGSGKSSIEKLLLALYDPAEGSILFDNTDIRQIDPVDLRRWMGYAPQDVVLFFGSIRDNIAMGAPFADDAAILRAAEVAGVTDFVNRHPSGFDMPVGERGEGLSGGQRQSVAVARALLMDPPLLVLDEPTNAMDNSTEERFKAKLAEVVADKTLLLVTHRASLLSLVDRIIVMDQGRLVADGPREQIMTALKSGHIRVSKS